MKRLYALAEALGETLTPKRIDLYLQCLSDIDGEKVNAALESALLTCKWFPKIAEIREMVMGNPVVADDAEADTAWANVIRYVDNWHPDIGAYGPGLTSREQYALRVIGGPLVVQDNFGGKSLQFLRRDFIAIWKRAFVADEHLRLLEQGDRKRLPSKGLQKAF